MLSPFNENNIQALAAVRHLTGIDVRLLPLDEITAIESTDQGFNVWITRYKYQDLKRGLSITGRGVVLMQFAEKRATDWHRPQFHGRGVWYVRQSIAWDAEQVGEEMSNAIRNADMPNAQHWMALGDVLAKLGDFTPFEIPAFGSRETVSEWADRVRRERMAGRVGTSTFPMDTYQWAKQGVTTERMTKHWKA